MSETYKVLKILVSRDLKVRYSASFLGYLWTIIDPLANALIYFMLFVIIFNRADAGYSPYFLFLLTGILPWQWFNAAVSESTRALTSEALLVKSTNLPRYLWVLRIVVSKGIEFIFSLPVLVVFWALYFFVPHWLHSADPAHLDWELIYFPLGVLVQGILCVGIGMMLAPLMVVVTDIQPLVRIVLRIAFYLTPIIFLLDKVPHYLRFIFYLNPMTGILEFYRAGFFPNPIHWTAVLAGLTGTAFCFVLGLFVFKRMEKTVLKEI
jgi:ABC-2 type transport system permease protein